MDDPIKEYLTKGTIPKQRNEGQNLLRKVPRYLMLDGILYRRGFSTLLLRCVHKDEAKKILENVHQGSFVDYARVYSHS